MANLNDTAKTLMTQGNFIRLTDRAALEARGRRLRAEAVARLPQQIAASVRDWFGRRALRPTRIDRVTPRAA